MRRAVIYARVSSDRQAEEGWSQGAQVERLREYAKREGIEVVEEVVAAESAKAAGRKAWRQVVNLLRAPGGPRVLLVEKADRATRNLADFLELDELRQGGVEIHSTREGLVISKDCEPSVELMWMLQVSFARHYVANLSRETRKGMGAARKAGRWTHRAPFGWRNAREDGRAALVPHEEEAAEVRRIFREYLAGQVSIAEIARTSPLGKTAVHKLLRHPVHAGLIPTDEGLVPAAHRGIVSPADWYEAQRRLNRRRDREELPPRPGLPYAGGLFACSDCGRGVTGGWAKGRSRRYPYLWCPGKCWRTLRVEQLEEDVEAMLAELVIPENHQGALRSAIASCVDVESASVDADRRTLRAALNRLDRDARTLYRDRLEGVVAPDEYQRLADDQRQDRARLEARLEAVERVDADWRELALRLVDLCCDAPRIWRALSEERHLRRALIEAVSLNRTIGTSGIALEIAQPFETVRALARSLDPNQRPWPPEDPQWLPTLAAFRIETVAKGDALGDLLRDLLAA